MDHLRGGVVALVVILHAAVTCSGIGGWYYHEPAKLGTVSRVAFLAYELHLQAFFMGLLFLVAYRGNWLLRSPRAFGLFWLRLAVIVGPALWVGVLIGGRVWAGDYSRVAGGLHWQSGLYCLWESLFCTGVCLGLTVIVRDQFNRHTPLTRFLSDNSFAVYSRAHRSPSSS